MELTFTGNGKTVASPVYVRLDAGPGGEPCLLGTNAVMPLGMMTPGPGVVARSLPSPKQQQS